MKDLVLKLISFYSFLNNLNSNLIFPQKQINFTSQFLIKKVGLLMDCVLIFKRVQFHQNKLNLNFNNFISHFFLLLFLFF